MEVHDDRDLPVCGVLGFGVERWHVQRCLVRLVGVSSGGVSNVILSTARFYAVVFRTVAARTVALVADDLRFATRLRRQGFDASVGPASRGPGRGLEDEDVRG